LEVGHTEKTQAVENRRKDIAIHQKFYVGTEVASCGGKLFLEPERNQEWSGTGCGFERYPVFVRNGRYRQRNKGNMYDPLGYAEVWVVVISSKAPIRAETRLKEAAISLARWASNNGFKISP
jgi:hypothetical protein